MKTVSIYGASDDLIEVSGIPGADEFASYKTPIDFAIWHSTGEMRITAIYGTNGCWSFALGQTGEEESFPDWPVRITQHERGYSTLVEIDVPDGSIWRKL